MKKRIDILTTALNYAGAETQLVNLAIRLKMRGWDVRVISMLDPRAYTKELAQAEIPLASLGMRRGVPDPRTILKLAALLRKWRPQVVHSHMVHANLLGRVARLLCRVPVLVSTAHNRTEEPERVANAAPDKREDQGDRPSSTRWLELAYRLTDPLCDLTTNVSRDAVDRYVRVRAAPRNKIRFMPNGIDTSRFKPDAPTRERLRRELGLQDCFAWLAVGRLEAQKDHANMVHAFSRLVTLFPAARLLIAGQGTLELEIKALVTDLGLDSAIRFLGVRQDVPAIMGAADAYVMSSAYEGMPLVLLEAAAAGLPVVATDVGGNREAVLAERSGFLVPPHDADALASAMQRLMTLPEPERKRLGRTGRDHVEAHFSLDKVVEQWEALYEELSAKKR